MISFNSSMSVLRPASAKQQVERLNTEDLVREIEQHPAIWDSSREEYADKSERDRAWQQVILRFLPDHLDRESAQRAEIEALFRKRWKSMRTCFARELNRQRRKTSARRQYLYYDLLRFLDPVTKNLPIGHKTPTPKKAKLTASDSPAVEEGRGERLKDDETATKTADPRAPRRTAFRKRRNPMHDECDKMFLMSLIPDFQRVPGCNKMRLKLEMMEAISRAQAPFDDDSYATASTSRDTFDFGGANLTYAELQANARGFPHATTDAEGTFVDFAVKLETAAYSSTEEKNSPASSDNDN